MTRLLGCMAAPVEVCWAALTMNLLAVVVVDWMQGFHLRLAAAETWNVETLRSETWCPKRKSRNVTPYCSENDISGFHGYPPPQNVVISGVSSTKTPFET